MVHRCEICTPMQKVLRDFHFMSTHLAWCLNSVLNVKAVVAAFNQALVGAFSVIVQLHRLIDLRH